MERKPKAASGMEPVRGGAVARKKEALAGLNAPEIGHILQQQRKNRALTLEQVAEKSNVSRSMLSQIERGEANPTYAVLWRLTRTLGLSIGDLVALAIGPQEDRTEFISASNIPEFRNADGVWRMRILSPPQTAGETEWYEIEVEANSTIQSMPHRKGAWEHLTVLSGRLAVSSGDNRFELTRGDTARYPADVPHAIINSSSAVARAILVTLYR
jgi:transcriptional regulator with XRE-family HTH domain